ncbi:hypothetical protein [Pseudohongiella sp. O18]|uniref:hypothetical protein n=1 Tax=Pseudohongiella sp. O18 TaxID=2904248 RepID=UPI001F2EB13B|nr:hypothetical protein [Pseudohongiella sp. O18]
MKSARLMFLLLLPCISWSQNASLSDIGSVYKLPTDDAMDVLIQLVEIEALQNDNQKIVGSIILSVLPASNPEAFNCSRFIEKLGNEYKELPEAMLGPFICEEPNLTVDEALEPYIDFITYPVDSSVKLDAHWAWYAATGDELVLRNLLNTYLRVEEACRHCIEWSFSSNFNANSDVRAFFGRFLDEQDPSNKARLLAMPGLSNN